MTGERDPLGAPTKLTRARFDQLLERRASGEPLQYVLGRWGFRTLDLMVDRRVLIPRPETEQVVEVALAELDALATRQSPGRVVDLGTGSGAIALSVAAERPGVEVWGTDASPEALQVAAANLAGLGGFAAARVRLAAGDWWAALPEAIRGRIDVVVTNPPYISTNEMSGLDEVVREWEPAMALHAGPRGSEALEQILETARDWLRPAASLVAEIAPHQAAGAVAAAIRAGFTDADVRPDAAGRDRVLVARVRPR